MAKNLLGKSIRPMIISGGGVVHSNTNIKTARPVTALQLLAEKLQAPVLMSTNGRGSLSDDHPLALGAISYHQEIKTLIEEELANGSKINAIKILKEYMEENEELPTHHSLRGCKDAIDYYALRYTLTKKIKWCRDMIEVHCSAKGIKMGNYKKVKSKKDDRYTWHYSDWEFLDDQYGHMVNDGGYIPTTQILNDINNIYKKYKLPKYNRRGEYI
mgnify:CR=1 FL=1